MSEHAKLPAGSGTPSTASSNQWIVRVSDNFNYAEDDGSYTQGSYATYAEALAICPAAAAKLQITGSATTRSRAELG